MLKKWLVPIIRHKEWKVISAYHGTEALTIRRKGQLMDANDAIVYLCKCVIKGQIPDRYITTSLNMDDLYKAASHHMLAAMVGMAIKSAGIKNKTFEQAVSKSQRKTVILNSEKESVFKKLDEAKIWHVLLKGSVLRELYPQFGMRESADCDILFDREREEDVRDIMIELGYSVESYGKGHHDVYYKKPLTNMQMHVALFGAGFEDWLNNYYSTIKEKLLLKAGYEYCFRPEDFYLYVLAHNHTDFITRGTGLRSVIDTYIFLKKYETEMDWDYIRAETEKLKMYEDEKKNRTLSKHLFEDECLSDEDKTLLEHLMMSGAYGTMNNIVNHKVMQCGGGVTGRFRYILRRIILPRDEVKQYFPLFDKYKILLPFLPVYRIYRAISENKSGVRAEIRALKL